MLAQCSYCLLLEIIYIDLQMDRYYKNSYRRKDKIFLSYTYHRSSGVYNPFKYYVIEYSLQMCPLRAATVWN